MEHTQIIDAVNGPVAVITLDQPQKLNASTPRMAEEEVHAHAVIMT